MKYQEMFSFSDNDSRSIILKMVEAGSRVLEFGCANGNMTRYMSEQMECEVYIVEYEKEAFLQARQYAVDGVCGDILKYEWLEKFDTEFDYVIFADVLEHLSKPQEVLERVKNILKLDGSVLISVPNIAHNDILIKLYNNEFQYTPTGLLDDTHIHFFTRKSLKKCCEDAGYKIIKSTGTVLGTGTTEQKSEKEEYTTVLKNILRERSGGNVYQNIVELKLFEYCEQNSVEIGSFDSFDDKAYCKIYIDEGEGYDEETAYFTEAVYYSGEGYICKGTIEGTKKIKSIRFDPVEGEGCLISAAICKIGNKEVSLTFEDSVVGKSAVLMIGEDPKIILEQVPKSGEKMEFFIKFSLEGTESYVNGIQLIGKEFVKDMKDTIESIKKGELMKRTEEIKTESKIGIKSATEKYVTILEKILELEEIEKNDKSKLQKNTVEMLEMRRTIDNLQFLYQDACRQSTDNYNNYVEAVKKAQRWEEYCDALLHSTSWKITKPMRIFGFIRRHMQKKIEAKRLEAEMTRAQSIKFSILMPVYNVEICWLEKAIQSVQNQIYENWELCIVDDCSTEKDVREYLAKIDDCRIKVKLAEENSGISVATNMAAEMATGDFYLLMDNDDEITADALLEFARCILDTNADVVYSDQDNVDIYGTHSCPVYKPDWSPDLFRSQMYIGHLCGFKKELYQEVGGFRKEFDGSQDYDLMLRITEKAKKIEHIAKVLYSWRTLPTSTAANPDSKPYAQYAGLNAVQAHLDRTFGEGNATAVETDNLFVYDVEYKMPENVKISIIIPTKDYAKDLKIAIDSIFMLSTYKNFEIIIMNNNSEEKCTFEYFEEVQKEYENVRVVEAAYEFNWSKLNNHGMREATGDVFIFLNNDVRIISPDWMERLASRALRENTGAVGAMLLYDDGTIQHAGVVAGFNGWADHAYKGTKPKHCGTPFISPMVSRNVIAVTGACMAVSRKSMKKIGDFDEQFIICGSDVELCIRAYNKGMVNVYDAQTVLMHYESKSRGTFVPEIDFELSRKVYDQFNEGDPYYNLNLDYFSCIPTVKAGVENYEEKGLKVVIPEVTPITFRKVEYPRRRLNILLPSLNPEHVFGGIATAYKFFNELVEKTGYDCRVILVDSAPSVETIDMYKDEYLWVSSDDDSMNKKQMLPFYDRVGRTIPVSDNDYFIFTGWWTAYCIQTEYQNWKKDALKVNPFIYFIQDYEPGFYAWSTKYMLADATYRTSFEQIAVFNSRELKEYFDLWGYKFKKSYVFAPVLNDGLKQVLKTMGNSVEKKKQILVYGRPNTQRNAFELVVEALRKWVEIQSDIKEWTILSAGESHGRVELGRGKYLESVGKLSIDKYAEMLQDTYAGVSLMVSPHPSYPPLEMSVYGAKVITNKYANKDMSVFNENIITLEETSPYTIAFALTKICNDYNGSGKVMKEINSEYCSGTDVFPFMDNLVTDMFEG